MNTSYLINSTFPWKRAIISSLPIPLLGIGMFCANQSKISAVSNQIFSIESEISKIRHTLKSRQWLYFSISNLSYVIASIAWASIALKDKKDPGPFTGSIVSLLLSSCIVAFGIINAEDERRRGFLTS